MDANKQDVFFNRTSLHSMAIPWSLQMEHGNTPLIDPYGISLHFDPSPCWDRRFSGHFSCLPFQRHLRLCDYSLEPAFIRKRNERERQRVRCVNEGYARLRQHLPQDLAEKRLSKVETLRAAIGYIKQLQELLDLERLRSPVKDTLAEISPHSFLHPTIESDKQGHCLKDSTYVFCKEEL
ncbi:achaete-scute homolog 4 [Pelobates cultripes]|uniref:Achaete-scute homolog 4 n=1 Tax=Pelobates cultripes TaxID=61616 RepID=A0AAD1RT61_PELCU|nr:achaete-scute homolog 4 [Pelobates cultripes]